MADLKTEFEGYMANKAEYLASHEGKFIALKDGRLLGVFEDRLEAIKETCKSHQLGTFLVQHVTGLGDQARYYSRLSV